MLLTFLMLLGAIPFIKKGGKNLPGELGSGMAFSLAFLLGGGYMLALFHLWRLALLPAVLLLIFSLCSVLKRRTFWKGKYDFFAEKLADSARNKNMELPGMALFFLLFTAAFLYLWFLACEKELPCGWDPAFHAILAGKILKQILIGGDDVLHRERGPVLARLDGIGQRHVPGRFLLSPEVHQDLILDTAGRVGREAGSLVDVEGLDPLDQADGADGKQVLLIGCLRVVLLHNMGHQTQIAFDQRIACVQVSFCGAFQIVTLLLGGKRLRKGTRLVQPQRAKHGTEN